MSFLPTLSTLSIIINSKDQSLIFRPCCLACLSCHNSIFFSKHLLESIIMPKVHIIGKKCINILVIIQNFQNMVTSTVLSITKQGFNRILGRKVFQCHLREKCLLWFSAYVKFLFVFTQPTGHPKIKTQQIRLPRLLSNYSLKISELFKKFHKNLSCRSATKWATILPYSLQQYQAVSIK